MTDLVFGGAQERDPHLVFGTADEVTIPLTSATISGTLPLPRLSARIGWIAQARVVATLPPPTLKAQVWRVAQAQALAQLPGLSLAASAKYLTNTQRPTVRAMNATWQETDGQLRGVGTGHSDTRAAPQGWAPPWQAARAIPTGIAARRPGRVDRTPVRHAAPFQRGAARGVSIHFTHQDATPRWRSLHGHFQDGHDVRNATRFSHQDGHRGARPHRDGRQQVATALHRKFGAAYQTAAYFGQGWASRFQAGAPPLTGVSLRPGKPPPPNAPPIYSGDLLFQFPLRHGHVHLVFGEHLGTDAPAPGEPTVVPIRKVYLVINNVSLHRVADGALVPAFSLTLSLDADSWTWGFSASLPASAQALIEAATGPVELRALVNGTEFRVLSENISRERSFGEASIRISGRGHNAVLAAPYAPVMTFSNAEGRTARQLMDDVLTLNGVPLGWTVDWELADWNVPARAFSHQGTWVEALASIAGAAGGYLLPHASAKEIRVRHRYPTAPWHWDTVTPDYVLPVDAVARESLRWLEKPAYNRVFVSGQDVGVLGQVTRAGTAGDVLAPMVVDTLITEAAAARQRGRAVLADTGPQFEVSLRLPVLEETAIIEPGAFVEYQDGSVTRRGVVRSTQIEAGMPEVWQTLGVQGRA
jgi:hypothetical protein